MTDLYKDTPANYTWWKSTLAGNDEPVHDGVPELGYYRKKNKYGPDIPVAIWLAEGEIIGCKGQESNRQSINPEDEWTYVCKNPISYDEYLKATETGEWSDDVPTPAGHNLPDDPHAALAMELEGDKELAEQFLNEPVTTQEQADKAAAWSKKLTEIAKKADNIRKVDKQPHLDAGKAVDDKWNPIRDDAKSLSTALKRHLDKWLQGQARIERERQAKAQAELDAKRIEAEKAAANANNEADAKLAAELAEEQKAIEAEAKERSQKAGRTGSSVSLRTFVSATITDYDKALIALRDHPEMREIVQKLANRAIKAGVKLDGVERHEEKRAA